MHLRRLFPALFFALLSATSFAPSVRAQTVVVTYSNGDAITTDRSTTVAAPLQLALASGSASEAGAISGNGTVTKTGGGALTLNGANTYTGGTTLTAGTLGLGADNALGTGMLTINGGELRAVGNERTLTNAVTLNGSFTLGRSTNFSGAVTLGNDVILTSANPDTPSGGAFATFSGIISGAHSLTFTEGTNPIGTIVLSGTNSYTGGTTLTAGILQLGNSGTVLADTGAVTVNGGTLRLGAASETVGSLAGTGGTVELFNGSGRILTVDQSTNATFSGVIQGAGGSLVKTGTGTLTLTGTNLYTAGTTISTGTLQLGNGGTSGSVLGDITNHAALAFNRSDALTFSGVISGTGSLTQAGTGTLTLAGANTYTGSTTISAGRLVVTGDLTSSTFAIGSGSVLELNSPGRDYSADLAFSGTGTLLKTGTGGIRWTSPVATFGLGSGSLIDVQAGSFGGGSFGNENWTANLSGLNVATGATFNGVEANVRVDALTGGGTISSGFNGAGYTAFTFGVNNGSGTFSGTLADNDIGALPGSFVKAGTGTQILTGASTYTGGTTISAGTLQIGNGGTTGSITGNVTNNAALSFNRSDALTYAGVISGTGSLTKLGAGILTLTGTNSFTGGTTLSAGTLQLGSGGTSGSVVGNITDNATLVFNRSDALTFSGAISGSGILVQSGAGTLTLSGASTFTGGTTISAGTLALGASDRLADTGAVTLNGGALALGSFNETIGAFSLSSGALTGTGTLTASSFSFSNSGALSVATPLAGSGALTKTGAGTLTLSGTNTYSGGTTVSVSTLQIGNGGTSGSIAGNITNNAALAFNRSDALTFNGVISGTGSLTQAGTGTQILTGASTYTGGTTISAGILQIGNGGTTGSITGNVTNNAALSFNRSDALTFSGVISGSGSLTQSGSGTLTLSGANSYSGGTTLAAGTLALGSSGALGATGSLSFTGGTLQFSAANSTDYSSRFSTAASQHYRLDTNGQSVTLASALTSSAGSLTKSGTGTLTLTGANSYSGGTTLAAGTLALGSSGALGATGSLSLTGGTLQFSAVNTTDYSARFSTAAGQLYNFDTNAQNVSLASALTSSGGSLTKLGTGTLTLSGANTFTGGTTLSGGTLVVVGSLLTATGTTGSGTSPGGDALTAISGSASTSLTVATGATVSGGAGGNGTSVVLYPPATDLSPAIAGGRGATAVILGDNAVLNQAGVTTGGTGGTGTQQNLGGDANVFVFGFNITGAGGRGGDGASLGLNAILSNTGTLSGGAGGASPNGNGSYQFVGGAGGGGGAGASFGDGGTLVNTSTLTGGHGAAGATPGATRYPRGGAGGNGGAGASLGANSSVTNTGTIAAGHGGSGGVADNSAIPHPETFFPISGGAGGSGATGLSVGNASSVTNGGTISGGAGASGGAARTVAEAAFNAGPAPGLSGTAGAAVAFASGGTLTNTGMLSGGNGAAGALGQKASVTTTSSAPSAGAPAVTGANLTIINSGTISGGLSGDGVTRANAIALGGTANSLELRAGSTITGNVVAGGTADTLILGGTSNATLSSANQFQGFETFQKTGPTTWTVLGSGSFGSTSITGGTLQVGNGGTTGSLAGNIANNAALTFNRSDALTYASVISGTGSLTKLGAGTMTLSGTNTYTGTTTVTAGTLQIGNGGTSGSVNGNIVNDAALAFNRSDALTYAGVISGTGALTKTGAGTLTLTGANTYAGGTTVSAGTLEIGAGGTTGSIVGNVTNEGDLLFNRSDALTFGGAVSGSGYLIKDGAGTLTLAGANTYTGTTIVFAGTLQIGNGSTTGSVAGNITNNATLAFNRSDALTFANAIAGTGALTKSGAGTLTLAGTNTYTGNTTVSAGTLQFSKTSSFYTGTIDATNAAKLAVSSGASAAFNVGGTGEFTAANLDTLRSRFGSGATLGLDTTNAAGSAFTYSTALDGSLNLAKLGTGKLILAGASTYTGNTSIGGGSLEFSSSVNSSMAGNISGSGALVKSGSGTLTFSGNNAYSGGTTLAGGTLELGSAGALGSSGPISFEGGTLRSTTNNRLDYSARFSSAANQQYRIDTGPTAGFILATALTSTGGSLTKLGSAALTLTGNNTYDGGTTISAGILVIGNGGTTGWVIGNITNNGSLLSFARSDAITYSNVVSGTGSLAKIQSNTLTLTGENTYTGSTQISGGTLQLGNGGTSGSVAGNIIIFTNLDPNSTLAFNRSDAVSFAKVISGAGSLVKLADNTLTLSGANTYMGSTTIAAGTLRLGHANGAGSSGTVTVAAGATLDTSTYSFDLGRIAGPGTLSGGGTYSHNMSTASSLAATLTGSASLTKSGTGTITLTAENTYTGGTTISAGTLQIGNGGTSGSVAGNVANNSALIFNRSDALMFSGAISGSGSLTKSGAGPLTLSGANSYTGGTTISAGTLQLGHATGMGTSGSVSIASGATLDSASFGFDLTRISGAGTLTGSGTFAFSSAGSSAFSTLLAGTATLTKSGLGTLTLSSANTYTGGTTISAGAVSIDNLTGSAFGTGAVSVTSGATLKGSGRFTGPLTLAAGATFSPGNSPGLMTIGSGSTLMGITLMEIAGLARGSTYDAIDVDGAGALTFGGTLQVTFLSGFTPTGGEEFDLVNFTTLSGTFSTLTLPSLGSGLTWDTTALYTTGAISVTTASAIPEPSTYAALAGAFMLGLAVFRRRRRS